MELEEQYRVLRKQTKWAKLFFYQKTDVLYQLTFKFTKEYLMKHGDRTVDQMVQAARSGKQNIVEGAEDGKTSTSGTLERTASAMGEDAAVLQDAQPMGGLRAADREDECGGAGEHRPHPMPHGGQDDDFVSEEAGEGIRHRRRHPRKNDSCTLRIQD